MEHPVLQETRTAPAWSRIKAASAPIAGTQKYPEQDAGSTNNFF